MKEKILDLKIKLQKISIYPVFFVSINGPLSLFFSISAPLRFALTFSNMRYQRIVYVYNVHCTIKLLLVGWDIKANSYVHGLY